MKIWDENGQDTAFEADVFDLISRIDFLKEKLSPREISEGIWSLGFIDGMELKFDYKSRELITSLNVKGFEKITLELDDLEMEKIQSLLPIQN